MKFPGKLQFLHKNNKMPKYLMTQCLKIKMFFSVITKNLSWEISKEGMGLSMKNFSIMWVLKSLKGGLANKSVLGFLGGRGVDTPIHTMFSLMCSYNFSKLI